MDPVLYSTIGESLNDSLNGSWNSGSNDSSDGTEAYNPNHQAEYWQEIKAIRKWAEKREDKRNQAGYERNLVRWSHETAVALIPCVYQAYARGDSVGAPEEHHKDMLRSLKNRFTGLERMNRDQYHTELHLDEKIKQRLAILLLWMANGAKLTLSAYRAFYYLLKADGKHYIRQDDGGVPLLSTKSSE
jgi:hypothetical protein